MYLIDTYLCMHVLRGAFGSANMRDLAYSSSPGHLTEAQSEEMARAATEDAEGFAEATEAYEASRGPASGNEDLDND